MKDKRLEEILNEISGIFDLAYTNTENDEDRDYINAVEEKLINYLQEKGLIEEE